MTFTLIEADCIEAMASMDEASIDAIVTDPPYGLRFMGKAWDKFDSDAATVARAEAGHHRTTGNPETPRSRGAREAGTYDLRLSGQRGFQAEAYGWGVAMLRVLKPGGHLLIFGGTRTYHRLACALEDAGFEIRDTLCWLYGSGFPKSLDVSKAIDKAAEVNIETLRRIAAVGEVIRQHRESAGLTPQQVSQAIVGTPSGACWNWEHIQLPSLENWAALKALLDIPPTFDALVEGDRSRFIAAERAVLSLRLVPVGHAFAGPTYGGDSSNHETADTAPATPEAERWQGWGTALKPAFEPIVLARKPLTGTVAQNVLEHGTGALNIDGTRIEHANGADLAESQAKNPGREDTVTSGVYGASRPQQSVNVSGRWPANVLLDEQAAALLDEQSGERGSFYSGPRKTETPKWTGVYADSGGTATGLPGYGDSGGASRFFYVAKADREERNRGLEHREPSHMRRLSGGEFADNSGSLESSKNGATSRNHHPTVKPVELMQWLCRLITPPKGTVLDPFTGSGSTGIAALREGFEFIGIEREADYCSIARDRILGDAPLFNTELLHERNEG